LCFRQLTHALVLRLVAGAAAPCAPCACGSAGCPLPREFILRLFSGGPDGSCGRTLLESDAAPCPIPFGADKSVCALCSLRLTVGGCGWGTVALAGLDCNMAHGVEDYDTVRCVCDAGADTTETPIHSVLQVIKACGTTTGCGAPPAVNVNAIVSFLGHLHVL
jgi:hypothetical protein